MSLTSVLLVDDEVPFVQAVKRRLARRGLDISTAFSGAEALEYLQIHGEVDVVVVDVRMPGMDGITTLGAIKDKHPLTEVIMLTGHATMETALEGMRLGAFDYLTKPCDIEKLMAKICEAKAMRDSRKASRD